MGLSIVRCQLPRRRSAIPSPSTSPLKTMVGLEGLEPPTRGLGKLEPLLTGSECVLFYYFFQRVTGSMTLAPVLVLTRFEQKSTTVLLQRRSRNRLHNLPRCFGTTGLFWKWSICALRAKTIAVSNRETHLGSSVNSRPFGGS